MQVNVLLALLVGSMLRTVDGSAADLPVSYLAERQPLRAAVTAANSLTFALFRDLACTVAVTSQPVSIDAVTSIETLRQLALRNTPAPPPTVRLTTTLHGVTTGGTLYLRVTGPGVVGVGGDCQVQAAQVTPHLPVVNGIVYPGAPPDRPARVLDGPCAAQAIWPDRQAAAALDALDPTTPHQCELECRSINHDTVGLYDVSNCRPSPGTCTDNLRDGDESDVDCGGTRCQACTFSAVCTTGSDCASQVCTANRCDRCGNDPYCGGPACARCEGYGLCYGSADCANGRLCQFFSGVQNFACVPATCGNGTKDGAETDVDCGGDHFAGDPTAHNPCGGCAAGRTCINLRDCASGVCTAGVCQ
jgi:hypothetical protein